MPEWHRAVPLSALSERAAARADCGGVPVCLALAGGQPVAVADACAHRGTALSGGLVRDGVLTCPGHFWRYDLRTGQCLHGQRSHVALGPAARAEGLPPPAQARVDYAFGHLRTARVARAQE